MPQSIPKGLTRAAVLQAIADLDAGIEHPFGSPTGYEVLHEGRCYAPKAVIGLACRSLRGRVLLPEEFSGGEAPGQANYVLRELGFTVVRKRAEVTEEDPEASGRGRDWTPEEVDLVVADYFAMLAADLSGTDYSKADHKRHRVPPVGHLPRLGWKQETSSPLTVRSPPRPRRCGVPGLLTGGLRARS